MPPVAGQSASVRAADVPTPWGLSLSKRSTSASELMSSVAGLDATTSPSVTPSSTVSFTETPTVLEGYAALAGGDKSPHPVADSALSLSRRRTVIASAVLPDGRRKHSDHSKGASQDGMSPASSLNKSLSSILPPPSPAPPSQNKRHSLVASNKQATSILAQLSKSASTLLFAQTTTGLKGESPDTRSKSSLKSKSTTQLAGPSSEPLDGPSGSPGSSSPPTERTHGHAKAGSTSSMQKLRDILRKPFSRSSSIPSIINTPEPPLQQENVVVDELVDVESAVPVKQDPNPAEMLSYDRPLPPLPRDAQPLALRPPSGMELEALTKSFGSAMSPARTLFDESMGAGAGAGAGARTGGNSQASSAVVEYPPSLTPEVLANSGQWSLGTTMNPFPSTSAQDDAQPSSLLPPFAAPYLPTPPSTARDPYPPSDDPGYPIYAPRRPSTTPTADPPSQLSTLVGHSGTSLLQPPLLPSTLRKPRGLSVSSGASYSSGAAADSAGLAQVVKEVAETCVQVDATHLVAYLTGTPTNPDSQRTVFTDLASPSNLLLVDARSSDAYVAESLEGSVNMEVQAIFRKRVRNNPQKQHKFPVDKNILGEEGKKVWEDWAKSASPTGGESKVGAEADGPGGSPTSPATVKPKQVVLIYDSDMDESLSDTDAWMLLVLLSKSASATSVPPSASTVVASLGETPSTLSGLAAVESPSIPEDTIVGFVKGGWQSILAAPGVHQLLRKKDPSETAALAFPPPSMSTTRESTSTAPKSNRLSMLRIDTLDTQSPRAKDKRRSTMSSTTKKTGPPGLEVRTMLGGIDASSPLTESSPVTATRLRGRGATISGPRLSLSLSMSEKPPVSALSVKPQSDSVVRTRPGSDLAPTGARRGSDASLASSHDAKSIPRRSRIGSSMSITVPVRAMEVKSQRTSGIGFMNTGAAVDVSVAVPDMGGNRITSMSMSTATSPESGSPDTRLNSLSGSPELMIVGPEVSNFDQAGLPPLPTSLKRVIKLGESTTASEDITCVQSPATAVVTDAMLPAPPGLGPTVPSPILEEDSEMPDADSAPYSISDDSPVETTPTSEDEEAPTKPVEPYTKVLDNLYIGSDDIPSSPEGKVKLKELLVTHVLNVATEVVGMEANVLALAEAGFVCKKLHVRDHANEDMETFLRQAITFIETAHTDPTSVVFVHCKVGVSRSATIVIGYLMKYKHWHLNRAYDYLRKRRPGIQPNLGFMITLRNWEVELHGSNPPSAMSSSPDRIEIPFEPALPTLPASEEEQGR